MTQTRFSGYRRLAMALVALILCCAITAPVPAATKYNLGSPEISATVDGVNEFTPGQDATIHVLVRNTGVNELKQLDRGTIDPEDLPTTAKQMTVGLASGSTDILIKTDPQMVGDLKGNANPIRVNFVAKITENATYGEYQMPLTIRYRYVRPIEQETGDVFEFTYTTAEQTIPLTIRIKPLVQIEVMNVTSDPLTAGSEGYVYLKIQNTGPAPGKTAVAKITRNGNSPVIPTDSSVFIGNFPSGGVEDCKYRVSVAKDAMSKTYPLDVAVTYTDPEGVVVTSRPTTIGIPVYGKAVFNVTSPVPVLNSGSGSTIEVRYRNDGVATVYNAQARLSTHEPVTINGNTAYLGDLKPGESATATYDVRVDGAADSKEYVFDSKIRFRDALANSQESDTIPVTLRVAPGSAGGLPGIVILFIGIIAIVGAGVVLWNYHHARKMR